MNKAFLRLVLALLAAALYVASAQAASEIRPFQSDSWEKIVSAHQGQAFVVVVWSLDCAYCGPSFKALAQASKKQRLPVVNITTDRADDPALMQAVQHKLAAAGLATQTWAFGSEPPEKLRYAIDRKWRGEMPRSYWYDGRGGVQAYSGVITDEVVTRMRSSASPRN